MNFYNSLTSGLAKVISFFMLLSSVFLTLYGVYLIAEGIVALYKQIFLHAEVKIVLYFVEAIDIFLISLVFLIFGLGVHVLFSFDKNKHSALPDWLTIKSFGQLKTLLMETIVASSFVFFITYLVRQESGSYKWDLLVIPASIVLLSISLYLFSKQNKHS